MNCWLTLMRPPGTRSRRLGSVRSDIESSQCLRQGGAVIINYGMGITQHRHGTAMCSNRQSVVAPRQYRAQGRRHFSAARPLECAGDRTVGITEIRMSASERNGSRLRIRPATATGHNGSKRSRRSGDARSKALICLGGNLRLRCPIRKPHSRRCGTRSCVHIATTQSLPFAPREAILIPPCLGRHRDRCSGAGRQSVTGKTQCRWSTLLART